MKKFLATILAGSLFFMPAAHAEIQTYTGEGEYYMSDFETPNVAQQRAKQGAEQNACEQAGVFVKSHAKMIDHEIAENVIETMTSGILKIIDTKMNRKNFDNNTTLIRVTIQAQIDIPTSKSSQTGESHTG